MDREEILNQIEFVKRKIQWHEDYIASWSVKIEGLQNCIQSEKSKIKKLTIQLDKLESKSVETNDI